MQKRVAPASRACCAALEHLVAPAISFSAFTPVW